MCGISGIFTFNKTDQHTAIRRMSEAMAHRGPDASCFYADESVYLAHRRLSIIDLSERSNQPLADTSGRYRIAFNGEIYNYRELRAKLAHYPFSTESDSETLLAAYLQWGTGCLQQLQGMFAFVVWDKEKQELFVARDRLGVKPVYYYKDENGFLFASEIRALLASDYMPPTLNREALSGYFAYQSFYTPQSVINGIEQLPAASWMRVRRAGCETGVYWHLAEPPLAEVTNDAAAVQQEIRQRLLRSVERRLVADVPVAAFLSGGIDSSAIVGLMAEVQNAPQTFTIAYEEKEYDESSYAAIVAKKFNTQHHNILVQPQTFLDELQNALAGMDSPSGDGVNTYVVSKAIRKEGIKVALSGAGGDELFAGYPIFRQWLSLRQKKWLWNLPAIVRNLAASRQKGNSSRALRMRQLLKLPDCDMASVYPVLRQVMPNATIEKLTRLSGEHTALQCLLATHRTALNKLPLLSQLTAAEYFGYTQHTLLKDTDQMSMAVALEVREPYFDHELIEYVLRVPDSLKLGETPKTLLVNSLGSLLPHEIVHRKKQGFLMPWQLWMKEELRSFCDEKIKAISARSFVQEENLQRYWQQFLAGDESVRWAELWLFVVLETWLQRHHIQEK